MLNSQQLENWADRLLAEYEEGRKDLGRMKTEIESNIEYLIDDKKTNEIDPETNSLIEADKQDKKQINSMINDMSFSIEWMRIGRRPGNLRGIDRRSAYQRRVLLDMDLMPSLEIEPEERTLNESEKQAIINILIELSHRERQCYLLHMAQGWSMQEIADELNIKKSSVQKFIERAKNKVKAKVSCHTIVV